MDELKIDLLPYLCLKRIFEHLTLSDLTKCRTVSRLFKFYAEETALVELIAVEQSYNVKNDRWYLTNAPIDFDNSISWKAFLCFKSSPFKLDQLRLLQVCLVRDADVDCEFLSHFKQLVHLEICWVGVNHRARTLALPNLKVLWFLEHGSYVLKTPKLEVLKCQQIELFQFDHSESIKELECKRLYNRTAKFKNLEVLKCECLGFDLDQMPLSNWKELKELDLNSSSVRVNHDAFTSWMIELMRQRDALRSKRLKIYLNDVPLVDANQLSELEFMTSLNFQFKNYRLLRRDSYPKVWAVHFDELDVEFSDEFFVKFPEIGCVSATGSVDRDAFEWFLKNARAMFSLALSDTSLGQAFMDRLPSIINSRLVHLTLWGSSNLVTNFDFVLQFKHLQTFHTGQQFGSLELPAKMYRQLYDLYNLRFCAGNEEVCILHCGPIKNNYELNLSVRKNHPIWLRTFHRENLKWAELATVYDQLSAPAARKAREELVDRIDMDSLF